MDAEDVGGDEGIGEVGQEAAATGHLGKIAEGEEAAEQGSREIGEVVLGEEAQGQESPWAAGRGGSCRLVADWEVQVAVVVVRRRPDVAVGEAAFPWENW